MFKMAILEREINYPLYLMRFVAAMMIMIHHLRPVPYADALFGNLYTHYTLDTGVSFFFILSGFMMRWIYPEIVMK